MAISWSLMGVRANSCTQTLISKCQAPKAWAGDLCTASTLPGGALLACSAGGGCVCKQHRCAKPWQRLHTSLACAGGICAKLAKMQGACTESRFNAAAIGMCSSTLSMSLMLYRTCCTELDAVQNHMWIDRLAAFSSLGPRMGPTSWCNGCKLRKA